MHDIINSLVIIILTLRQSLINKNLPIVLYCSKEEGRRENIPFASIWLWLWYWVRWNFMFETSDLLQGAEAPFSKSRWTKSLREKSPTRLPALLTLFKGNSGSAEGRPFPLRFPDFCFLLFWPLLFLLGFEAQLPIVVEVIFFTNPANILSLLCITTKKD